MPPIDPEGRRADLDLALGLAELAAAAILPHFRRCAIEWKPDGSEVTAADRDAEALIRRHLAIERPDDGVIGEEFEERPPSEGSDRRWIVDPIDGTSSFVLGLAGFGTLVALLEGGEPTVGVIHLPASGESTYAAVGLGCWYRPGPGLEAERVRVAEGVPLAEASVSTTGPHSSDIWALGGEIPYRLIPLIRSARQFRFVGDCLQHALVCRGRLHAAIDTLMNPWDIAALVPCVEEAGGVVTGLDGRREGIIHAGSLLTSCDSTLHRALLTLLAPTVGPG